jgi:hypothetical protein
MYAWVERGGKTESLRTSLKVVIWDEGEETSTVHSHEAPIRSLCLFSRPSDHDYFELDSIPAFSSRCVHDQDLIPDYLLYTESLGDQKQGIGICCSSKDMYRDLLHAGHRLGPSGRTPLRDLNFCSHKVACH